MLLLVLSTCALQHPEYAEQHKVLDATNWRLAQIQRDGEYRCSGVFLTAAWILTARHCVQMPGERTPIRAERLTVTSLWAGPSDVESIKLAGPSYDHLGELSGSDLALIKIAPRLELAEFAIEFGAGPNVGTHSYVILQNGNTPTVLQTRVLFKKADTFYTTKITGIGDSGTPAVSANGHIIGIASWHAFGWSGKTYSVFNRVDIYEDWILDTIAH